MTLLAYELKGIRRPLIVLDLNDSFGGVGEGEVCAKEEVEQVCEGKHELCVLGSESVSWK